MIAKNDKINISNSNQRKAGAILSYITIIVNTLVQLLYTPLLIRMLGQSEYGLYSLVSSIIGYLTVLDLGFGNAIIVYTAKYRAEGKIEEEKKLHGMFKIIFMIIGVITGLLGLVLFLNVNNLFGNTMTNSELHKMRVMMLILAFNLMITFSFSIYSSIISAYEKFIFQKIMALLNSLLKPLIMIPLLFLGYKSITMCIIITIVNVTILFSNYIYCKKKLKISTRFVGFDKALFKTILGYSIWIFMGVIVDKVNWSVDNFVLGAVSGTIAVSVYSLAATLNHLFINLSTAVSGVMLPKMSKMVAKNASSKEITEEFIKVGRIQYFIIFLMASGLVLVGKNFFNIWAGKGYEDAYYIALLLIIPVCIPLVQNLGISIMQAKNMHRFRSILLACISIANIAISIPLAKAYGGIGAAIGTALSLLIGNGLIINIYYYKKVGINVLKFWKEIIKMTIPFIIPLTIIILFMKYVELKGIIAIGTYAGIYTVMYCIVAYTLSMNKYERDIINKVLIKIHLKKA